MAVDSYLLKILSTRNQQTASPFKGQKLMFLVATVIMVIAAGVLIANVQESRDQGVKGERRWKRDRTSTTMPSSAFLITPVIWQVWRRNRGQARSDGKSFRKELLQRWNYLFTVTVISLLAVLS